MGRGRRKLYGVGVNDISGATDECPFYDRWHSMLRRCYSPKTLARCPTYKDCTVCDEWLLFSNFKEWMKSQVWDGLDLDKDIAVPGNLIYGPDYCHFVSREVNSVLTDHRSARGPYPQGVTKARSGRFIARCMNGNGGRDYLGIFATANDASAAYVKHKIIRITEIAKTQQGAIQAGLLLHAKLLKEGVTDFE